MRPCVFSIPKDNGHSRKSRDSKRIEVMMKKLSELTKDKSGLIAGINGDARFISRITSIGLTPGCCLTVIKNEKRRPILVYSRDTMIALNRNECDLIDVEEIAQGEAV